MDKDKNNHIYYDSLNAIEQEKISTKLERDLLGIDERFTCGCLPFCRYIFNAFWVSSYNPVPSVLYENLDKVEKYYLKRIKKTNDDIFFVGGDPAMIEKYKSFIINGQEIKDENIDFHSLGIACIEYVHNEVLFLRKSVYAVVLEAFQESEGKDFVIVRLPFLFYQRPLIKNIIRLSKMLGTPDYKKWGAVIFDKDAYGDTDAEFNAEIFRSLCYAEFDILNPGFYE